MKDPHLFTLWAKAKSENTTFSIMKLYIMQSVDSFSINSRGLHPQILKSALHCGLVKRVGQKWSICDNREGTKKNKQMIWSIISFCLYPKGQEVSSVGGKSPPTPSRLKHKMFWNLLLFHFIKKLPDSQKKLLTLEFS